MSAFDIAKRIGNRRHNKPPRKGAFLLLGTGNHVNKEGRLSAPRYRHLTATRTASTRSSEGDMLEAQEKESIHKGMLTLWVIWAAMLGSLLMYIFLCYQLGVGFKSAEGSDLPISLLRKILAGMGIVVLLLAYFMRRSMLSVRTGVLQPKPVERMAGWNTAPFVAKYATAVIVALALSESIGIYGFVLFLLGDSFKTLYTFIVVSALAMVYYRPKREELEKLAMAYKKRDEPAPEM